MKIDFLTIFPESISSYMNASIMGRAQDINAISITAHNIRDFSTSKHQNVDDTPCGGGAGMVMQVEPIYNAVEHVLKNNHDVKNRRVILLSAKGKRYTQRDAERLKKYEQLVFICGRYEGVDERVAEHIADEELSIGDFVLTGGELGAMVITDSVVRLLPGVLGNEESAVYESHSEDGYREHPQYTRPEEFHGWNVPKVLLSGNHAAIEQWRKDHANRDQSEEN